MACTGSTCVWVVVRGQGQCDDGASATCVACSLLEADASDFHDQSLIEATRKIKRILAAIPEDSRGRQLSFLHTNMGTLLAWLSHDGKASRGGVTAEDDDATVAKALKLKTAAAAGAGRR